MQPKVERRPGMTISASVCCWDLHQSCPALNIDQLEFTCSTIAHCKSVIYSLCFDLNLHQIPGFHRNYVPGVCFPGISGARSLPHAQPSSA